MNSHPPICILLRSQSKYAKPTCCFRETTAHPRICSCPKSSHDSKLERKKTVQPLEMLRLLMSNDAQSGCLRFIAKLVDNSAGVYCGFICKTRQHKSIYFSPGGLSLSRKTQRKIRRPLAKRAHGRLHKCGCPRLPRLPQLPPVEPLSGPVGAIAAAAFDTGAAAAASDAGTECPWKVANAFCCNWTV